ADFISRIATVSIMALLARRLDPNQFGLFSYALALSMTWVLFMDWGWNSVLTRKAKQQNFSSLLLSVFSLKIMVFIALMGLVVMVPALLPRRVPRSVFICCFFYASAMSFQDYQSAAIAGMERFDLEWIFKLIPRWAP